MAKVVCLGQLVADVVVRPVTREIFSVDTMRVEELAVKNGGDCMNVAVNLAKLGEDVAFVGRVGEDSFAAFLRSVMDKYGIDSRGLVTDPTVPTTSCVALIGPSGERSFLYCGGANDKFCYEDIDLSVLDDARLVFVGGTFLLPSFDGAGAARLFAEAQRRGIITVMDVTWDTTGRWLKIIRPCLPYLDWFMPSLNEAKHIAGTDDPEAIASLLRAHGVRNVVIKLGTDGVYICTQKNNAKTATGFNIDDVITDLTQYDQFTVPAYKVNAIDTTGAGDSFVAGFMAGLLQGKTPYECGQLGAATAAFCVQATGATDGVPDLATVKEFIKKYK